MKDPTLYLHHESTADGIEGIRKDSGQCSHCLCHRPLGDEVGVLLISKDDSFGSIIEPEVCASVNNDTLQEDRLLSPSTCWWSAGNQSANFTVFLTVLLPHGNR